MYITSLIEYSGYGTTQQPEIRLLTNSAATIDLAFPISLGLEVQKLHITSCRGFNHVTGGQDSEFGQFYRTPV